MWPCRWLACILLASPAVGVAGGLPAHLTGAPSLFDREDGPRSRLRDAGLDLRVYWVHLLASRLGGGGATGSDGRYSGSADYFVVADLERLGAIPGGSALLQAKSRYGRNVNPAVGALADPLDDADGDRSLEVIQLWYEQAFWRGRASVRLGYLDQQTIVDRNAYANSEDTQFLATLLDNQNAVVPLATGLGATLFLTLWDEHVTLIASAGDANGRSGRAGWDTAFDDPGEFFGYLELGYGASLPLVGHDRHGTYRVGVVVDPRSRAVIARPGDTRDPDVGPYVSLDQALWAEPGDPSQGLGAFVRYGFREPDVNAITHAWSAGLEWAGLVPGRDDDVMGLGVYGVHGSPRLRGQSTRPIRREVGLEAYHRMTLVPWLAVTPDVQYVYDPGGVAGTPDAWIVALRVRATL